MYRKKETEHNQEIKQTSMKTTMLQQDTPTETQALIVSITSSGYRRWMDA